eukprot:gnl/MRDRNA2_/MRDRNA2_147763_c0_seq1.p1 gnl/MRDRNA2_/MRDRNA2_147763_c0~~gnl/MRDRNA2_/MRDRNA2_147763_c0_seq1.p1  ORF type:complete len:331 (-),score=56.87 gnl/MRDRNA2_/MRDRNA2_147763_c0_seq1:369-1361(-)
MHIITLIILQAFLAKVPAKGLEANHNHEVDWLHYSTVKWIDKLAHKMLNQRLHASPLNREDLDDTTLAKSGHLGMSIRTSPSRGTHVHASRRWMAARVAPAHSGLAQLMLATSVARRGTLAIHTANILNPGEYPDPVFVADVQKRFPNEGIANVFEARALLEDGYKWLDVRTSTEYDEGHIAKSVNIPIINSKRVFDSEVGKRVYRNQAGNADFINTVRQMFPDKETKLLIACSDSRKRAMNALEALDEAGYKNIIGVKGGWLSWQRIYDQKFQRRRNDVTPKEVFTHKGGTAMINADGAGDGIWEHEAKELISQRDTNEWIEYSPPVNS